MMRMYVWLASSNEDYTAGDVVVVARSVEEAKKLALKPNNPEGAHAWCGALPVPNPDYVFPVRADSGVCWYGPGGG